MASQNATAMDMIKHSLSVIKDRDPLVKAFSYFDYDRVIEQASTQIRTRQDSAAASCYPIAVKEIIDCAGYPASQGVAYLKDRVATKTSSFVQALMDDGAIIAGITTSTQLATIGATKTCNPCDLKRTPGGSSSGSAAAVGAGMVPVAIGTQTIGSIIRPASYCGVVGMKPTHGILPLDNVLHLSDILDHGGIIAASCAWVERALNVFLKSPITQKPINSVVRLAPWYSTPTEDCVFKALDYAEIAINEIGIPVKAHTFSNDLIKDEEFCARTIQLYDLKSNKPELLAERAGDLSVELSRMMQTSVNITEEDYEAAIDIRSMYMEKMLDELPEDAVFLAPATVDMAPFLGNGTGKREPQRIWTVMGWPTIVVPVVHVGTPLKNGRLAETPVGVQLIARPHMDHELLTLAKRLEACFPRPTGDPLAFWCDAALSYKRT